MTAYDQRNQADYDGVTRKINDALSKMRKDSSIKVSVPSLAALSGVHRNTINNRAWPRGELDSIKAERLAEKESVNTATKVDPKLELEGQLDKAKHEILYWYRKAEDNQELYEGTLEQLVDMSKSKDLYREKTEELKADLASAKSEITRLSDLLNMVKEEQ